MSINYLHGVTHRRNCWSSWALEEGRTSWLRESRSKNRLPSRSEPEQVEEAPAGSKRGEELKAELDDLLDEIDEVLEDNAEEFVKSYVQKGGQ